MRLKAKNFAKFLRYPKKFIPTVKSERLVQFLKQSAYLNSFLEDSQIYYIRKLEFKLKKKMGFRNLQEK